MLLEERDVLCRQLLLQFLKVKTDEDSRCATCHIMKRWLTSKSLRRGGKKKESGIHNLRNKKEGGVLHINTYLPDRGPVL